MAARPKLRLGEQHDRHEEEASRIAEAIVAPDFRPGGTGQWSAPRRAGRVVRRRAQGDGQGLGAEGDLAVPQVVHHVLQTPGEPLDPPTRSFMESRLGEGLGRVRVHADAAAAESARAVGAAAYAAGSHVVFAAGEYAPASPRGRRLIAHELVHVLQDDEEPVVRRAVTDFRVRGLDPGAVGDPDRIFFDFGATSIPPSEMPKIAALATPPGRDLTLNGFASEEGTAASRAATANARIAAVDAALRAAGHTGAQTPAAFPDAGVGDVHYRARRSVEVLPTPVGLAAAPPLQPVCGGGAVTPCGSSFTNAHPIANAMLQSAVAALGPPPSAAASALLATLFGGVPVATVTANVVALRAHVNAMPAQHVCHNECDAGCGRPAYNTGTGIGAPPAGALITLCPGFINNPSNVERAVTLIHEGAHGPTGLAASDIAYDTSRMIPFLTPAQSQVNTDSYVLLVRLIHAPGSATIGPASPDVAAGGMTAAEATASRRAVAFLEAWLLDCDFDTEIAYDTVHRSLPPAAGWAADPGDDFNRETVHLIAPLFGLTDPGAAAPFTQPTNNDKIRLAAIHDRYLRMREVVWARAVTVTKVPAAAGPGAWAAGMAPAVTVAPAFFALGAVDQVKGLLRSLVHVVPDISLALEPKYVDAADRIRAHRGRGP